MGTELTDWIGLDISFFLGWAAEPAHDERKLIGLKAPSFTCPAIRRMAILRGNTAIEWTRRKGIHYSLCAFDSEFSLEHMQHDLLVGFAPLIEELEGDDGPLRKNSRRFEV